MLPILPLTVVAGSSRVVSWGPSMVGTTFVLPLGDSVVWSWMGMVPLSVISGTNRLPDGRFSSGQPTLAGNYRETFVA
jgi:hypothetical protein